MGSHDCSQRRTKFSVVVPVFNEDGNLEALHDRLTAVMKSLGDSYEIIFVDDGSSDNSFQVLKQLHRSDKKVRVIRFARNFGQHPALTAGFDCAQGDIVITLDADLQNPPEEIPKLLDKLHEGYDIVFGVFQERKHSPFRRAGSAFSKWVLSKTLPVGTTNLSGFRAMRSKVVNQLNLLKERSKFLDGLLCWMGFKVGTVEVVHEQRHAGKTKYSPLRLVAVWLNMVTSFTDMPLKIATYGGVFLGATGIIVALFYFVRFLMYGFGVPGFATIVILLSVFSGIQLFCLGVLGEYIGRLNNEVRNRPEYIVLERLGLSDESY
jgi:glycosyltransferase involved in cell wall biosynthesis